MAATTAVMSSSTFLGIIRENKLVDESKLQECLRSLPQSVQTGDDALPIADALVEHKLLSRFQANLLLQGKSKSLRITSKYRLLDRLGAGGMGLVYLCEHIRMKRLVALKVLPNSQSKEPGNLERFYREAQAVAALKHPNIVQAYDVDTDNGIHYLVMEYIDGINLEKLVSKHGPLAPERAAHYMAQAAGGLQHAVERGLVHRDIKPSNLLIDREGYIKVLDMGLARFFDTHNDNITEQFDNNAVIGTADFISPEQALNSHDVDIRADIYSLGCTFYFLLAGKAPFHDANLTQKLLLHQIREPLPIEKFVPGIDPDMVAVVSKMMAKKPDDRYQTPGDVVEALAHWTETAIAPPAELPSSTRGTSAERGPGSTLSDQAATAPAVPSSRKRLPRGGRGSVTERITESAVRRIDGLPRRDEEDGLHNKKRWLVGGSLLVVALGTLVLMATKPWDSSKPTPVAQAHKPIEASDATEIVPKPPEPRIVKKPPPPQKTQALSSGFVAVKMDAGAPRPMVLNGGVRAQCTDMLLLSGRDLESYGKADAAIFEALRTQLVGGRGGEGTTTPIVPYAVYTSGDAKHSFTFLTVKDNPKGASLRLLPLPDADFLATGDFTDVSSTHNVWVESNVVLPKGTTIINSLRARPADFAAAEGGSTLRVTSGAILFAAAAMPDQAIIGAGKSPLVLDFNGGVGYLTMCVAEDLTKIKGGRELVMRAQVANLGNDPLVLSGLSGNVLRLDSSANANAKLVVQGAHLAVKDKVFRVNFNVDANLGASKGSVELCDAALYMTAAATAPVDRPLTLTRSGQLAVANVKGQLNWLGKISGGKLTVLGSGRLLLARRDNDHNGMEITGGTLQLAAPDGTPAGSGNVVVQSNGTLTGAAIIMKDLEIKGGVLQPGDENDAPLVCNGKLIFTSIPAPKTAKAGTPGKVPTLRVRLNGLKSLLKVVSKAAQVELADAHLQVTLAPDFKPERDTCCTVIENLSGKPIPSKFHDAPQFGTIKTMDGKWSAKITYRGHAAQGKTSGGVDVMLYDFAPVNP